MPVTAPSRADPFVRGASRLVGGPWGAHAVGRSRWWWTPLRAVLVLTVLTSVLAFLQKAPCRTHPWSSGYQYTRVCYTDVFALYYAEGLGGRVDAAGRAVGRLSVPYRDHAVEYPSVIGGLMWGAAEVTNLLHPNDPRVRPDGTVVDDRSQTFFDMTALMLALAALITTWTVAKLAGRTRVWDAAMFALAPTLLFHAYTNWDLAAVALAGLGMWAWSRRSPALAGVFLGLGVATKLYPVLIIVALLFCCWRAARMREWAVCAATGAVAFVAAYIPAWVLSATSTQKFLFPDPSCPSAYPLSGWRWFWSLSTTRGADWDSLWFLLQQIRGRPLGGDVSCGHAPVWLNFGVALMTVGVVGAVSLLVLAAPRRPRVPQVAFLLVAGFLLVNKVDSPQYVLWLLPLAVLARPRWPMFLAWQAAEVVVLFTRFYFFAGDASKGTGLPIQVFLASVCVRDVLLAVVMALVVREILRPDLDVVRAGGDDDPAGGTLDGASDRWAPRLPRRPAPASA